MNRLPLTKTLSGILLVAIFLQPLLFAMPQNAQAIDLKAASSSVVAAGIGCEVQGLLSRQLSNGAGNTVGSEIQEQTGVSLSVQVVDKSVGKSAKILTDKETCLKKVARAAVQVILRE